MTRVMPDVRAAVTNGLRGLLADRSEPFVDGVVVGTRRPPGTATGVLGLPYVLVADDGIGSWQWPAAGRGPIRITAWASTEDDAWDLAALSIGLLATWHGGIIRHLEPTGALIRTTDPDTDTPVCSGLLNATVHTTTA